MRCPRRHAGLAWSAYPTPDRKSTRLNSSHANISYAVFCLKKKKHTTQLSQPNNPACRLFLKKTNLSAKTTLTRPRPTCKHTPHTTPQLVVIPPDHRTQPTN